MEKIGLIAGNRKFPLLVSLSAKSKGYHIVAIAIKGDTSSKINKLADKVYWIGLNEFKRLIQIFKTEGVTKIIMAGQISPHRLFSKEVQADPYLKKLLDSIKDKKADTIFGAIADSLKEEGLELISSTTFIEDYLPKKGTLTKQAPDFLVWEDIYFGLGLAKAIGYLDIGQTVAVKKKAVVAVEALEGTDNLIRRAGQISRGGVTIVKVSKPQQDAHFDIPVIGLNTIKQLVKSHATCLAIETNKTLFIDKEESVKLADKKGISIVAL
jgi:UDP-2,3-diacylglucosamine hydrolase